MEKKHVNNKKTARTIHWPQSPPPAKNYYKRKQNENKYTTFYAIKTNKN